MRVKNVMMEMFLMGMDVLNVGLNLVGFVLIIILVFVLLNVLIVGYVLMIMVHILIQGYIFIQFILLMKIGDGLQDMIMRGMK